ncbi:MAG: hypothetical protein R3E32_27385 [Chitinophagales bacterium]
MKLRCVQDSIRLRVRKSDLQQLQETGMVSESIDFGVGVTFVYSLTIREEVTLVTAEFQNNELQVYIPVATANQWMNSNEVGIEVEASAGQPHILIEKDFPCLDRVENNKEDTFWELTEG